MNIKTMIFATLLVSSNLTITPAEMPAKPSIIEQLEQYASQQNDAVMAHSKEQSYNKKNYADFMAEIMITQMALSNPLINSKERAALEQELKLSQQLLSSHVETVTLPAKIDETEKEIVHVGILNIIYCLRSDKNSPTVDDLEECHSSWKQTKNDIPWRKKRDLIVDPEMQQALTNGDARVDAIVEKIKQQASE